MIGYFYVFCFVVLPLLLALAAIYRAYHFQKDLKAQANALERILENADADLH